MYIFCDSQLEFLVKNFSIINYTNFNKLGQIKNINRKEFHIDKILIIARNSFNYQN